MATNKNIDISLWGFEQCSVRYRLTGDRTVKGILLGDSIRVNPEGEMFAHILCFSEDWMPGSNKIPHEVKCGSRIREWQFLKKPKAILELESALATAEAEAKEEEARLKREAADKAAKEVADEVDFDEQPVARATAVRATRLR
jgi:hypothetical protein